MDLSRFDHITKADAKFAELHSAAEAWFIQRKAALDTHRDKLHRVVAGFIETGVFVYGKRLFDALDSDGIKLMGILQGVAQALGRPYIRARKYSLSVYRGKNVTYSIVELTVPNTQRLRPVVAALLLAAQPVARGYRGIPSSDTLATGHPLYLDEAKGSWTFFFVDDTGGELFDQFVKDCATDPVKRVLLKL